MVYLEIVKKNNLSYSAVLLDADKNPSKPFSTFPH